jgi:hypothetical protein
VDAIGDAGLRQPDPARDLLLRRTRVALEDVQDPQVRGVHDLTIGERGRHINQKSIDAPG